MPDSADIALMLASTYDRAGRVDEAEAGYRAVITKDPINAGALNDLSYMLAVRGRKLDEAVSLAQRAVAIDNANPSFLDTLGWAYYKAGNFTDARAPLEEAAAKTPAGSVILDHLAEVYFQLKLYKDAAGAWDKSLAGDSDGIDVVAVTYKRDKARQLAGR
jgi:Flp pilus assembly protein TadD